MTSAGPGKQAAHRVARWIPTLCLLAVVGTTVLLLFIIVVFPRMLVPPVGLTKDQLLKARNDVRTSLLAALGGAVALAGGFIGGYVGLHQLKLGREQLEANLQATRDQLELGRDELEKNLKATREGQITERFTRAIEQLGSEKLDVEVRHKVQRAGTHAEAVRTSVRT